MIMQSYLLLVGRKEGREDGREEGKELVLFDINKHNTYCSASLMFVINRVPNCRAVIRNRIYGFMKRLVSSSNALVLSTVTSDARFRSRIVRHWLKSLYIHFDAG